MSSKWIPAVLLAAAIASPADAAQFVIAPGGDNLVQFESKAKVETFTGKTSQVEGTVELDPAQLGDSITVNVVVNIASLDTGIGLRNKHMCDNHLDCAKFPQATFSAGKLAKASAVGLAPGQKTTFELIGTLDLHGVRQPLTVPVEMLLVDPGHLEITTRFPVKLEDFQIARPKMLMLKLNEVQQVTVKLSARTPK